jgi:hypothetical protein
VTDPQPQPVTNATSWAAAVTAVVGAVLTCLVAFGVITPDARDQLTAALTTAVPTVVGVASAILAGRHARSRVTPLARPRDAQGRVLVPVDEYGRHAAKYQQGGYVGPPGETVTPRLSSDYVISGEQAKAKFLDQLNSKEQPRVSTKEWADSVREIMRSAQPSSGRRGRSC